uniref:RNase H domain-containing protein n=1 Tax=Strongyloides stercoralis TaxID=6248 RepID=A0A0K0E595_STRER
MIVATDSSETKSQRKDNMTFIIIMLKEKKCLAGGKRLGINVSSNLVELMAVETAIYKVEEFSALVVSDSEYVCDSINLRRLYEWAKNN